MDAFWTVIGLIVLVWVIPCRYDPAIRIKEWQIKRGWHPESRNKGD